jgi:hypothetical protein
MLRRPTSWNLWIFQEVLLAIVTVAHAKYRRAQMHDWRGRLVRYQERKPKTFATDGTRPDWQPFAFAIGAGIAVALILSVASMWLPTV